MSAALCSASATRRRSRPPTADLAGRLGPRVLVCQTIPAGTELALGIVRDPELGPLIVVGAGGVLVELLADRAVALPPVSAAEGRTSSWPDCGSRELLDGVRGARPADQAADRGPSPACRSWPWISVISLRRWTSTR